jgi:hypothetical protein
LGCCDSKRFVWAEGTGLEAILERASGEEVEDQVGSLGVELSGVNVREVRVVELRHDLRLPAKPHELLCRAVRRKGVEKL